MAAMRVLTAGIVGTIAPDTRAAPATGDVGTAWYAQQIPARFGGTSSTLGGFLRTAGELGLEPLPLAVVRTADADAVSREVLETLRTRIFSELRGWKVDAV
ncbi:MAG: hypothetical protein ACRDI2_13375, partial [Chloroflexota bacterium]